MTKNNIKRNLKKLPPELNLEILSRLPFGKKVSLNRSLAHKYTRKFEQRKISNIEKIEELIKDNDLAGLQRFNNNIIPLQFEGLEAVALNFALIYNKYKIFKWIFNTFFSYCEQYMINHAYTAGYYDIVTFLMAHNNMLECDAFSAEAYSKIKDSHSANEYQRIHRESQIKNLLILFGIV